MENQASNAEHPTLNIHVSTHRKRLDITPSIERQMSAG